MTAGLGGPQHAQLQDTPAASLIAALHSRAEYIRREELSRAEGRWEALSPDDRRRLETLTQCIVDALLDEPTARLQDGTAQDPAYLESARYLFGLETRAGLFD
jgi:glutamyl-tRNA reductase